MTGALNDDFGELLRSAVGTFVRRARIATDAAPPSQIETLGLLSRQGPLSIAELARQRGVRHQSESATIGELRELGYVDRDVDPEDGRGWLISLTAAGGAAVLDSRRRRARWIAEATEGLTAEELVVLERIPGLLAKLAAA